jgi:bifunctional non-homologous end joining protein LigD
MALTKYNEKRNFKVTSEPEGKIAKDAKNRFVIQRHHASRLHYDFRLEMDGVLKSWAVPKGPSLNPKDKRLAMMVEDHPVDYIDFQGFIPEGNYGAGHVMIWDKGTFTPVDAQHKKITEKEAMEWLNKKGELKFELKGKKLKGEFVLVRLKKAAENSWLLIKHRDEYAVDEEYNSEDLVSVTMKKKGLKK